MGCPAEADALVTDAVSCLEPPRSHVSIRTGLTVNATLAMRMVATDALKANAFRNTSVSPQLPGLDVHRLEGNAFSGLTVGSGWVSLASLGLRTVEDGAFAGLRAATLDLSRSNLSDVHAGAFRDVELSDTLSVRDNARPIAAIGSRAFANSTVGSLDFEGSSIGRLEAHALSGLAQRSAYLKLSGKKIAHVGGGAFSNLTRANGGGGEWLLAMRTSGRDHDFGQRFMTSRDPLRPRATTPWACSRRSSTRLTSRNSSS